MRSTFSVLFYIKRTALRKDGTAPIMGRITINGEMAQFATRLAITPDKWSVEYGSAYGRSERSRTINAELNKIRCNAMNHYNNLLSTEHHVSPLRVKNLLLGLEEKYNTILALFRKHNQEFVKNIGYTRSRSTYNKYAAVYDHLCRYILHKYNRTDLTFKELDERFVPDFDLYLRETALLSNNTVWIYMMPVKRIIVQARNRGYLSSNPAGDYHARFCHKERDYLTERELERLIDYRSEIDTFNVVKDVFLFCCFTGLSYSDVKNLTHNHISKSFDNHLWIVSKRKKTGTDFRVRLLDIPKSIIDRYRQHSTGHNVFPLPSNTTCNRVLRQLSQQIDLRKAVTFHVARHTFATTVLLSHDVPIESVCSMLGHTNIKTTQIYARITDKKLSHDLDLLSRRIRKEKGW